MAAFVPVLTGTSVGIGSFVITGLSAGSSYAVRLASYNSNGYSQFALALPTPSSSYVTVVTVSSPQTFSLIFNDGYNAGQTTGPIPANANAEAVQVALQALASIRAVSVSLSIQSEIYDVTSTLAYYYSYVITYLDAGFEYVPFTIALSTPSASLTIENIGAGTSLPSMYLSPVISQSSAPLNVTVSLVSATELGVSWLAPVYSGGTVVTKYLVEWDVSPYFTHVNQSTNHAVVTGTTAETNTTSSSNIRYIYQITELTDTPVYVRVSAFNGASSATAVGLSGYSKASTGTPISSVSTTSYLLCNTMPIHCSSTPAAQLLYTAVAPMVNISSQQVASRLDITWTQPLVNQLGFNTQTILPHTPSPAYAYEIDISTQQNFNTLVSYNLPMYINDGMLESCNMGCAKTIGEAIQNVTVSSGNGEPLNGGDFSLLYIGMYFIFF